MAVGVVLVVLLVLYMFWGISVSPSPLCEIRSVLEFLGIADATSYRTHDLRRGHARDMQAAGCSVKEIKKKGQWRSPAFLLY